MFHASKGQTLTRTSQRHDTRSAATDGSKFNLFNSFSTHSFQAVTINKANKWQSEEKNLRPDALPVGNRKGITSSRSKPSYLASLWPPYFSNSLTNNDLDAISYVFRLPFLLQLLHGTERSLCSASNKTLLLLLEL